MTNTEQPPFKEDVSLGVLQFPRRRQCQDNPPEGAACAAGSQPACPLGLGALGRGRAELEKGPEGKWEPLPTGMLCLGV